MIRLSGSGCLGILFALVPGTMIFIVAAGFKFLAMLMRQVQRVKHRAGEMQQRGKCKQPPREMRFPAPMNQHGRG